jgi:hypothetical protein
LPALKISQTFVNLKIIVPMASSVYKWLLIPVFAQFFTNPFHKEITNEEFRGSSKPHPYHVSVVELEHNATDKTLEISCKIFTDDFEKVLAQNYKAKVDLINPPDRKAMDTLVRKYIQSHLSFKVDGRPVTFWYLGFEHDKEAIFGYIQVDNIPSVKKVEITNSLMHDMFRDQINLMHVKVGGERKSTKLDYPSVVATFEF